MTNTKTDVNLQEKNQNEWVDTETAEEMTPAFARVPQFQRASRDNHKNRRQSCILPQSLYRAGN